jgi:hypothetical protein
MEPTEKFPVVLEARQWEQMIVTLSEEKHRVAAPLIAAIATQAREYEMRQQQASQPAPGDIDHDQPPLADPRQLANDPPAKRGARANGAAS